MALRFLDSCDHYGSADITEKWPSSVLGPEVTIAPGLGRRGSAALRIAMIDPVPRYVGLTLEPQLTWTVGFAWLATVLPNATPVLALCDGFGVPQCELLINGNGTVSVRRGATVLGTSLRNVPPGLFAYIEFRAVIGHSGECQVHVDGLSWLALAQVDTQASALAGASIIRLGNVSGAPNFEDQRYDDVYICDGSGAQNITFLGDVRVDVLVPRGDGTLSTWTPSTGVSHYALVDDPVPNDDADYLSSNTLSQQDVQTFTALPSLPFPTIFGVQHCVSARKDDAEYRQMRTLLKSGASVRPGAVPLPLLMGYQYYRQVHETDPATQTAWTSAAVDALEAGMECQ